MKFVRSQTLLLVLLALSLLAACSTEVQTVEVTRLVNQEVAVEVTRVVQEISTVEVPVEVTRLVEVLVPVTPTETTEPPTETPTEVAVEPTAESQVYLVQAGDTLAVIAARTGVSLDAILAANNLTTNSLITVGQQLVIPGWDGELVAVTPVATSVAAPAATPVPVQVGPVGPNLLPNWSFEEGWYFYQGVAEWQIPNSWLLYVDEGPNTLSPGDGGNFLRPEIRVVPRTDIPPNEHNLFIFDGNNTIKAFKGGAPTSFAIFADVTLQPGRYRLTISFFPDIVAGYDNGSKVWAAQPFSSEARLIVNNGGTDWATPVPGQKTTWTYDFSVDAAGVVRVGGAFRSRYINNNNGWFLDAWSLQALGTP
ncbi:MAG: LysM peptidoglycan-binding domain-containing protein [Anaerolineales bacterium]|nr:LysM peptidoglycan-binding domain-containing protein [Anaerolineales bacterium]